MSFFGADKVNGQYVKNSGERLPPNWRPRNDPYDNNKVGGQIIAMYLLHVSPHRYQREISLTATTAGSIRWQRWTQQLSWPQLLVLHYQWPAQPADGELRDVSHLSDTDWCLSFGARPVGEPPRGGTGRYTTEIAWVRQELRMSTQPKQWRKCRWCSVKILEIVRHVLRM